MGIGNNQATINVLLRLGVNAATPVRASSGDIPQRLVATGVNEGVQESKNGLASAQSGVIQ